jgi:AsmA protein
MSKVLKIILGLFGLLIVLVLAAVIIIPLVVDPNDYREQIARGVEEQTGRAFEIEGEISLSVFPWLGLEVGRMRLGNPPGFGEAPFVEIGSAAVGARLVPLLSRRLEISTLRLDGLRVHLVQLADGSNNWDDLGGDSAPSPEPRGAGPAFQFERVDGLRLTDAQVRYEDRKAGSLVEASIPRLVTGELAPGKAFPVEGEVAVALDGDAMQVSTTFSVTVDAAEDSAALRSLSLAGEANAAGVRQAFTARAPAVRVASAGPSVEIDQLELDFEVSGADVPGGRQSGKLRAPGLALDLDAQTLAAPALAAELAGLRADIELAGTRIIDAPVFTGRLELAEFSPRELLQRLGEPSPETADPAVLRKAAVTARFRVGADNVDLTELQLPFDDTRLSGQASVGFGQVTRVRAELALDAIDLDRYLPPEPDEAARRPPAEDVPLAFEWLRDIDLDASFRAGQVRISGLSMTDLQARAVARDGVLNVQPFGAVLYGGQVRGSARLDAREAPARFSLQQSLSGFQLHPFVRDLAGFERLAGTARLDAELGTTAASTAGLVSGLNGQLSFDVSDGVFKGVNLWFEMQRAAALARGRAAPQRSSPDTEFRQLKGTAEIRDGVLLSRDLVGGLPFLSVAGRGEIDLAQRSLDYRLNATVIREAVDEATGERSELAGASVPLRLSGTLDSPSVSVDLGGLLREQATREALRRLGVEEEDKKALEQELKDQALDRVRGLRDRLRRED